MNRRNSVLGAAIAFGVLVPVLASGCGAVGGLGNLASNVPGVGGKCPDLSKPEAILAFDFASNFKISATAGAKLKAATAAAVELKGFADQIDADLKAGCGGLAKDLGARRRLQGRQERVRGRHQGDRRREGEDRRGREDLASS